MNKIIMMAAAILFSAGMLAETKPLKVLVIGDDPAMASDEAAGAVGYAELLQPYFDDLVTTDVRVSSDRLPDDPAELLAGAAKGDVVLLCKYPVHRVQERKLMQDIYLDQLLAINDEAKRLGAKIIWLTPVSPRYFTADSVQVHRLGVFPDVVRRMCTRYELPLIDMEALTFGQITADGIDVSAASYVPKTASIPEEERKASREGDRLTQVGAEQAAALLVGAVRADANNPLNKRLK